MLDNIIFFFDFIERSWVVSTGIKDNPNIGAVNNNSGLSTLPEDGWEVFYRDEKDPGVKKIDNNLLVKST